MILNASTALCLNICVVYLIGSASSLVLTLSGAPSLPSSLLQLNTDGVCVLVGVIKDILLVGGSVILLGSTVTFLQVRPPPPSSPLSRVLTTSDLQMFGYSIALLGLFIFKTKQEVVDAYVLKARSILSGR